LKLTINYDLLRKIKETNTGFSLHRSVKTVLLKTLIGMAIVTPLNIISSEPNGTIKDLIWFLSYFSTTEVIFNLIFSKTNKLYATNELRKLSLFLTSINIPTNYDLLLESYVYDTDYELEFNDKSIPSLKQNKYIMIPVQIDGEEKEVSIVQEHIIGSKEYTISYGSPKKVLKLAKSAI